MIYISVVQNLFPLKLKLQIKKIYADKIPQNHHLGAQNSSLLAVSYIQQIFFLRFPSFLVSSLKFKSLNTFTTSTTTTTTPLLPLLRAC